MTRVMALDTASPAVGIALSDGGAPVATTLRRDDPAYRGLAVFVIETLGGSGWKVADVERIVVNAGPGYLSSVRTGVAYANALGFSLGVPVGSVDALALLAAEAGGSTGLPVLALRHAGAGRVYAGLHAPGREPVRRLGPLADVVAELAAGVPALVVAGSLHGSVAALLPGVEVRDPGVEFSGVVTLAAADAGPDGPVTPITERSPLFAGSVAT